MAFSFVSIFVLLGGVVLVIGLIAGVVALVRASAKGVKEGKERAQSEDPFR